MDPKKPLIFHIFILGRTILSPKKIQHKNIKRTVMKVIVTYEVCFPGHSTRCSWISDSKPGYRRRKRGRRQVNYPGSARKTGNDAFSLYALCKLK